MKKQNNNQKILLFVHYADIASLRVEQSFQQTTLPPQYSISGREVLESLQAQVTAGVKICAKMRGKK
ncbi:MAG: hypothetical protein LBV31_00465 [Prevotellaceae bacterium]|nr:hypothetical protein [Prevotellaceae bacterium]